jgi:hypothetical protein
MINPTRKLIQKFKIAPSDPTFHPNTKTPRKYKLIKASNTTNQNNFIFLKKKNHTIEIRE